MTLKITREFEENLITSTKKTAGHIYQVNKALHANSNKITLASEKIIQEQIERTLPELNLDPLQSEFIRKHTFVMSRTDFYTASRPVDRYGQLFKYFEHFIPHENDTDYREKATDLALGYFTHNHNNTRRGDKMHIRGDHSSNSGARACYSAFDSAVTTFAEYTILQKFVENGLYIADSEETRLDPLLDDALKNLKVVMNDSYIFVEAHMEKAGVEGIEKLPPLFPLTYP